jgi:hypothetical protein
MPLDATEMPLKSTETGSGISLSGGETVTEMDTEHIYIGDEFADNSNEPTQVSKCESIRNCVNGTVTELTFFEEGFLKVREGNNKKRNTEHVLELRFLEPDPLITQKIATSTLWSSLGFGFVALSSAFVLPMTTLAQYTMSAVLLTATLALLCLILFVYRSEVIFRFCTASGQTVVLSLKGSFGCIRRMREMAHQVQQAILSATTDTDADDIRYLRAEMQAHYKLVETGVITREACSDGTALILSKFG